ncbi:hypothetical protein EGW08_001815, partial [Elysia chlorotica]
MASTGSRKRRHKSHGSKDSHSDSSSGHTANQSNQIERKQSRREQQSQAQQHNLQQQQQQQQQQSSCKHRQSSGCVGTILPEQGDQLVSKKLQVQHEQGDNQHQSQQCQENGPDEMKTQAFVCEAVFTSKSEPLEAQGKQPVEQNVYDEKPAVRTFNSINANEKSFQQDKTLAFSNSCNNVDHSENHVDTDADNVLIKNAEGKANLIEAIKTENFEMVKTLLDECSVQAMVGFYKKQMVLLASPELSLREQDMKLSLLSLLAVVSRLEGEHRLQLAKTDPVGALMAFIKKHCQSRELVSMVCVLLGMLLWNSNSPPWQPSSAASSMMSDLPAATPRSRSR